MTAKILHISKMKNVSGSENHLLVLLPELVKQSFEVHLCILIEPGQRPLFHKYASTLREAGVQVKFVESGTFGAWNAVRQLQKYMQQKRFDLVHTHLIHADLYGTLAARLAGIKIILSSRHNDDRFRQYAVIKWGNRLLARRHIRIIAISDWIAEFVHTVEGIPAEKIIRIHYGIDPERLQESSAPQDVRQQFDIPENVPVLGTIGRLTAQKGHAYLLRACQNLLAEFPEFRLVIIGEGELRTELEEQVRTAGLGAHVIFTGYRSDALALLSGFDVFVFPSLWEGLGLVLLEAMAYKKPIVASNVSAIPESVLDGTTGLLVPPKDAEALGLALAKLLRNTPLRQSLGEAGYRHLQEHFTVETMVTRLTTVYHEVLTQTTEENDLPHGTHATRSL